MSGAARAVARIVSWAAMMVLSVLAANVARSAHLAGASDAQALGSVALGMAAGIAASVHFWLMVGRR